MSEAAELQDVPEVQIQADPLQPLDFEVPHDPRGRIDWVTFRQQPENLKKYIESEAEKAVSSGLKLTQEALYKGGLPILSSAIGKNYEGSFPALRVKVKGPEVKESKPDGYWRNPKIIEEEARAALERGISLKALDLNEAGLSSLSQAMSDHYPGGRRALLEKINSPASIRRPEGYWENVVNIEDELERIIAQGGEVTSVSLRDMGEGALAQAISEYYPGGFYGIRERYGIAEDAKPADYWKDLQRIEDRARELFEIGVEITSKGLRKSNNYDLNKAAYRWYPGGIVGLRKKLGIHGEIKKENGYWNNEETIEREARKALVLGIELRPSSLEKAKKGSLSVAIYSKYKGGYPELRRKLGIAQEQDQLVSPDKADEMMRGLEVLP